MLARISGRQIALRLALTTLVASLQPARAQSEAGLEREIRVVDQGLNADYQRLLGILSKAQGQQLRVAERAWLTFITRNEEAVTEIARNRPDGRALILAARLTDIRQRWEELRVMLGDFPVSLATVSFSAGQADGELNRTYQQCLQSLPAGNERRLREAQRAWIDFRDQQARVTPGRSSVPSSLLLTVHRIASLKTIYLGASTEPALSKRSEIAEERPRSAPASTPNASIPDPFATAR